jgi:hypothetical protein
MYVHCTIIISGLVILKGFTTALFIFGDFKHFLKPNPEQFIDMLGVDIDIDIADQTECNIDRHVAT